MAKKAFIIILILTMALTGYVALPANESEMYANVFSEIVESR
jgi:hypothetical protein